MRIPLLNNSLNVTLSGDPTVTSRTVSVGMTPSPNSRSVCVDHSPIHDSARDGFWHRLAFPEDTNGIFTTLIDPTMVFVNGTSERSTFAIGPMSRTVEVFGAAAILKHIDTPNELLLGFDSTEFQSSCDDGSLLVVRISPGLIHCVGQILLNGTMISNDSAIVRFAGVRNDALFDSPPAFLNYVEQQLGPAVITSNRQYMFPNCTQDMISALLPIDFRLFPVHGDVAAGVVRYLPEDYITFQEDGFCKLNFGVSSTDRFNLNPLKVPETNVRISRTSVEFCAPRW